MKCRDCGRQCSEHPNGLCFDCMRKLVGLMPAQPTVPIVSWGQFQAVEHERDELLERIRDLSKKLTDREDALRAVINHEREMREGAEVEADRFRKERDAARRRVASLEAEIVNLTPSDNECSSKLELANLRATLCKLGKAAPHCPFMPRGEYHPCETCGNWNENAEPRCSSEGCTPFHEKWKPREPGFEWRDGETGEKIEP